MEAEAKVIRRALNAVWEGLYFMLFIESGVVRF